MIKVYPQPFVDFSWNPELSDVFDGNINFTSLTNGGVVNYEWNFGDSLSLNNISNDENPSHKYLYPNYFNVWLYGATAYGCADSVMHTVRIKDVTAFYIPNAFTPNENNVNEIFLPVFFNYEFDNYKFVIFNRWGTEIYSTNNPEEGWDGRVSGKSSIVQSDVYVWKINYKESNGLTIQKIGMVTLIK